MPKAKPSVAPRRVTPRPSTRSLPAAKPKARKAAKDHGEIPYVLHVHVVPKSPKNSVVGWQKDPAGDKWLKLRIAAPPEDGKANKETVKYVAKLLEVAPKQVVLASGTASRYKTLRIYGPLKEEYLV